MKIFIALLTFFLSTHALAFNNDLFLKGGFSAGLTSIETLDDVPESNDPNNQLDDSHSVFGTFGVNTSFGVMLTNWEFSAISTITFGKARDLSIFAAGDVINGSGRYRNVAIGPMVKYYSPLYLKKDWRLYAGIGPSWAIQTIRMDQFTSSLGNFDDNQKLTIESFGYTLCLGIQEEVLFKEMHPVFFEISYSHRDSYKISTVDASKFTETNVLTTDERGQEIEDSIILFNVGLILF